MKGKRPNRESLVINDAIVCSKSSVDAKKHLTAVAANHARQRVKWLRAEILAHLPARMPPKRKCACCPEHPTKDPGKRNAMFLSMNLQRKYARDNSWPTRTGDRLADIEAALQFIKDLMEEKEEELYDKVSNIVAEEAVHEDDLDLAKEEFNKGIDRTDVEVSTVSADLIALEERVEAIEHKLKWS